MAFFSNLSSVMPTLKYEFELRRVIFGLTTIVTTDPSILPGLVQQHLPSMVK